MTDQQQGKGKEKARFLKGRQRAEGRGQRAEGRGQRAEARGQKPEGRGQKPEGRGQKPEGRGQRAEGFYVPCSYEILTSPGLTHFNEIMSF
jgi:hypothetical protein